MSGCFAAARPEPRQCLTQGVDRVANRFGPHLHEVDIFRGPEWVKEQQLMDGGAATKREALSEVGLLEDVAQRSADDEVLFDLARVGPRRRRGPFLDIGAGNHASIASGTFRLSFQVGASDTLALRARLATSRTDGSSGLSDFAFRASGRRLAAWRACPK